MLVALRMASRTLVSDFHGKCGMHDRSTIGYRAVGTLSSLRSGGPAVDERRGQCWHEVYKMKQNRFSETKTKPDATVVAFT